MISIFNSNKNSHNISVEEFNELKYAIAASYGSNFYEAYCEYAEKLTNFNVVSMIDTMKKLMDAVNSNLKAFNYDLTIVEFLTSNKTYTLDSKACTVIANKIAKTEIGNKEYTNLPTFYKFFKRAGDKNLTVTWMWLSDHVKYLEDQMRGK